MSGDRRLQHRPRVHPVAGAPVEALLASADEMARRWAVALILARPLERIGEVPLADLAREAPALCAQAVRALESDAELELLAAAGASPHREASTPGPTIAALAGASDAGAAVEAVEALRGILWEALLDELGWPIFDSWPARQVADLADRLACVCATALAAALSQHRAVTVHHPETALAAGEDLVYEPEASRLGRRTAVLVDELDDVAARPRAGAGAGRQSAGRVPDASLGDRVPPFAPPRPPSSSEAHRTRARPLPWDTPLRANRPVRSPPEGSRHEAAIVDTAAGGPGPVVRAAKRPTAPSDGSA